jgi:hypothetical protein
VELTIGVTGGTSEARVCVSVGVVVRANLETGEAMDRRRGVVITLLPKLGDEGLCGEMLVIASSCSSMTGMAICGLGGVGGRIMWFEGGEEDGLLISASSTMPPDRRISRAGVGLANDRVVCRTGVIGGVVFFDPNPLFSVSLRFTTGFNVL